MSGFISWAKQHKIISGVVGLFVVILVLVFLASLFGLVGMNKSVSFDGAEPAADMDYRQVGEESVESSGDDASADIPGIEIREGSVRIDTEDTAADESQIRSLTESYNGYIEEGSQAETNTQLRTYLTARVPASDFSGFLEDIRAQFNVEDYHVSNYRIEVEEQTTELDIIADTASKYAAMKAELNQLPVDAERVALLMDITEKELELKRQENYLRQQVDRVTRRGDMATLRITLEERLSADIWPEDLGNEFRDQLQRTIDRIVTIAIAIVTTSLVVFMTAIQWAVYLLIILLVLWLAYRLLRRIYNSRGNK